ncbi:MAG TPA: hypothetical protein VLA33_09265 [Gemmatimonadota bacterium]|nr:hypothetical protein [Gemmatimonadota bacterium]
MNRAFALLALVAFLPATACTSDAAGGAAEVEVAVDTVGGVERLTYGDERAAQLPWRFDTTTVIGGFGVDDPDYQFGGLSSNSLAGDADGNLYVLDADGIRVLGYGPDGSFLGSWGREGGGPGELGGGFGGGPRSMALGPGDTLWIDDRSNQRLTLLPVDGGEPASLALPQSSRGFGGAMTVDSAGVVAILSTFSFSPGEADGMPPRPIVRMGRDGEIRDTLWTAPAPPTDMVTITAGRNQLMMMMSQRFAPGFYWERFDDGAIALAEAVAYDIRFVDASGEPERILRRNPPPRLVTETDRQTYLDSLLAPPEEETEFNSAEIRRERAEATTFADSVPRIVGMRRDTRDRLWVGVSEERPGAIERIDVYDRDGTLLGELRDTPLPDHFFADGRAAIIDRDELDVQRVHVMRLIETPEALESAAD